MKKVLIIGGPTGIGKSALGIRLAKRYDGVIVSADSMQIYKGLNIGTGKVTEDEKEGILHTMIDIVQPNEEYSVQKYYTDATKSIESAWQNGKLPIVVGGTGLYINALLHPQNFAQAAPNPDIRRKYTEIYETQGAEALHSMLANVDKVSADKIAVKDVKRTIRALEIYETTGRTKSDAAAQSNSDFDYLFLIPEMERETLYAGINRRVDQMMQDGFIEEVERLRPFWNERCMEAIGYREIIEAIRRGIDPHSATVTDTIKQNTRRYAKRQITFFKWIEAEKHYLQQPYYETAIRYIDPWLTA